MKAVTLENIGELKLINKEKPVPKEGEVLVKIKACGICGSDIPRAFVTGSYHFPTVLGHEFSGKIIETGDGVSKKLVDKKVAIFPLIPCNECEFCKSGLYAQCKHYSYFGSRTDGGFEEYLSVPLFNLIFIDDNVSFEEAAMIEPATVAQHVIQKAYLHLQDTVAIYGAGPIGILVAKWAEIYGAQKVFLIDVDPTKVNFAKKLGFKFVCNGATDDPIQWVQENTDGQGTNVAVEATGTSNAFVNCLDSIKAYGKVIMLGNPKSDCKIPQKTYDKFMRKEGNISGIFNSVYKHFPRNEWEITAQALSSGKLQVKDLITHKVSIDRLINLFDIVHEKKEFYCKAMMINGK